MAILKARPKVRVRVPNEIRPGASFTAMVLLDCRREVEVDFVDVRLTATEGWTIGAGKHQVSRRQELLALGARLSERRTLAEGRTELPVTIPLPEHAPASYDGTAGRIDYELAVHVSVPWWPDRRARFEVHVIAPETASRDTTPIVYSSDPTGPSEREPHAELSLAATWTRAGDVVTGAIALSNVEHNRYSEIRVGLLGTESLYDGGGRQLRGQREHMRYRIRLGAEQATEGEMIPFRFRLPPDAHPSFGVRPRPGKHSGLVALAWQLELVVGIRWARDLTIKVPFEVLPRSERPGDAPARIAPPTVGSDRLREMWTEVGGRHGLTYEAQSLSRRFGETTLTVRREHQGRDGIHLLAELRYPELQLALEVEPARGLKRLAGGMRIGVPGWDRDHYVIARDEGQVADVLTQLVPLMEGPALRRMDDEALVLSWRDAGQTRTRLDAFLNGAVQLAERMERLRRDLPPPPALADGVAAWRALAERIGGRLETARMRVSGALTTLGAEARVAFDEDGQPLCTWLSVTTPTPLDLERAFVWRAADGALTPPYRGEARALAVAAADGAAELAVERERVALRVDGLLGLTDGLDADWAEQKLSRMARLIQVLRGDAGPYR